MMSKFSILGFIFVAFSMFGMPAMAQTPDGETPANEGVCDGLKIEYGVTPGLYGLCVAYCEALDCPDPSVGPDELSAQCRASNSSVLKAYNRKKTDADPAMPCVQPPPACPCWSPEEIGAVGFLYEPHSVSASFYDFPQYDTFSVVENRTSTPTFPYGAYHYGQVYYWADGPQCVYAFADFAPNTPGPIVRVQNITDSDAAVCEAEIRAQYDLLVTSGVNPTCSGNLCP